MLEKNLTHHPSIDKINTEQEAIELIRGVKTDLSIVNPSLFPKLLLATVLKTIEKGFYSIKGANGIYSKVDLSEANYLIANYKLLSEEGCRSCRHMENIQPLPGETISYCGFSEDRENILNTLVKEMQEAKSPQIKEHFNKGCENKKIYFRPLDVILKETKQD